MIRKTKLSKNELVTVFNIIKLNMESLGVTVTDKDKASWCNRLKEYLKKDDYFFYVIYHNKQINGFVIIMYENNKWHLCELQLSNKLKLTRTILNIITYLFTCSELAQIDELYFRILKTNKMSNKTFTHLGAKQISSNETGNFYVISRQAVGHYLSKFNKWKEKL